MSRTVYIIIVALAFLAIHAVIYLISLRARMKRAQKDSEENRNLWKDYVSMSPAGILILTSEGNIREINPAAEKILGVKSRKSTGLSVKKIFSGIPYFNDYLNNRGDGAFAGSELEYRHPRGSVRILSVKSVCLNDDTGHLISILDITEIREYQTRRDLRQKELQTILDLIPTMIYVKDALGIFLMANQACAESMGYSIEEIVGSRHRDLHDYPDEVEMMLATDRKVLISGEKLHVGEESITLKSGKSIFIDTVKMPYRTVDSGEMAVLGVSWDITDKVHLQREIQKNESLRSLGVLAGGIAHDFNNQLMGILGYLELLSLETQSDKGQEYLEGIKTSSKKAAALVRDLLSFSREYHRQVKIFDIHKVLDASIQAVGDSGALLPRIERRYKSRIKTLTGDPGLLQNAFQNLILNAGDALGNNGHIEIETEDLEAGSIPPQDFSGEPLKGKYLMISVSDDGEGMSEEVQTHIFEPFYSTKADHAGSGMGLAAVYGTVKSHRGLIDVKSSPGCGTVFKIFLPSEESSAVAADL